MSKTSKKELILKTAKEHFAKFGYELTNLDKIAQDCNITKPAIYYYFKDKASLYEAVLISEFELLAKEIVKSLEENTPQKQLKSYIEIFGNFLVKNEDFSALFARELASEGANISDKALEILTTTILTLSKILEANSSFKNVNPFMIQLMIVSTLTNFNTTKNFRKRVSKIINKHQQKVDFSDIVSKLSDTILKGLS